MLIPIKLLIIQSWQTFLQSWKDTFRISRWLILPALLFLVSTLCTRLFPNTANQFTNILVLLAALIIDGWVSVRLIEDALLREKITKTPSKAPWTRQVLGYFWLKLFTGIALIGAFLPAILGLIGLPFFISLTRLPEQAATVLLFGGVGILALPSLWLGVCLLLAPFLLFQSPNGIDDLFVTYAKKYRLPSPKQAIARLVESYELVRGRFWHVLARLVIPGIIFGFLLVAAIDLADTLVRFIAGPAKIETLFGKGVTLMDANSSGGNSYTFFLQSVGQALFLPLFMIWQAKLFAALKETKNNHA